MDKAYWFHDAVISDCGKYRPWLQRRTPRGLRCVFVMLNPSTADAEVDDPTIRRCKAFAHREGLTTLVVVNLFTVRSPTPTALWTYDDPVGPEADSALLCACEGIDESLGEKIIFAWGALPGNAPSWFVNLRNQRIASTLAYSSCVGTPYSLGITSDGSPRHPLYLNRKTPLTPWKMP